MTQTHTEPDRREALESDLSMLRQRITQRKRARFQKYQDVVSMQGTRESLGWCEIDGMDAEIDSLLDDYNRVADILWSDYGQEPYDLEYWNDTHEPRGETNE
jgi:hypothetical protein